MVGKKGFVAVMVKSLSYLLSCFQTVFWVLDGGRSNPFGTVTSA